MEDFVLRKKSKNLLVGDIIIGFSKEKGVRFEIPFSGMAFYNPKVNKPNLIFMIDNLIACSQIECLWGSYDFFIPKFLYKLENDDLDWIVLNSNDECMLSFRISSDWNKVTLYEDNTGTNGKDAFQELGSIFSYAVLNHHAAVFHGVVMEYNGMGILVMAKSGTGKTTHTRMWRDIENALILNGDRCLVRKKENSWFAYGMPWSGSSGEYINRKVPITCIVSLERDSYNHVEELNLFDSTLYLMQRIFAPMWPGELQNKGMDLCDELAQEIPVIRLYCTPEPESVQVLKDYILERFG